jgi:hypothetical protein
MLELKKTDEWAFFFFFFGGNLLIFNAIIGLIVGLTQRTTMTLLDGSGWFIFYTGNGGLIAGTIINMVFGILALLVGLKLFFVPFRNFITKIDLALTGFIMMLIGFASFTTAGFILVVGGIYCFIYRFTVEGANNPKGQ